MDSIRQKKIEVVRNWIREQNRGFYPIGLEPDAWLVNKQATMLVDKLEGINIEERESYHTLELEERYRSQSHD